MRNINTTRFGEIEVSEDHVIHFKDGMIGFPKLKNYILVESGSMPLLLWLQSLDEADIAFPLIEPYFFKRDYKAVLSDADRHTLNFEDGDRLKVFVVMTIPENMTQMTVNMKAPVVIDINKAAAAQIILQDRSLEVRTGAHEGFSKALSNFTIDQTAPVLKTQGTETFAPVNVRSVINQGFSATV